MIDKRSFSLAELQAYIQQHIDVEFVAADESSKAEEISIDSMATLQTAQCDQLSFLANPAYRKYLASTKAAAVILHPNEVSHYSGNKLVCADPYIAFALLSKLFSRDIESPSGVHPSAVVDVKALVDPSASIGPQCVVQAGAVIEADVVLEAGVFIGADTVVGAGSLLHANVSISQGVSLGKRNEIHNNAVIGSEGFGFAKTPTGWLKVHQLGSVVLGDDVEIGASTTIDRGALDNTMIGSGVKIDNQVQIGHNVQIGAGTAIAACAGVAGSAIVGANCTIAGGAGLVGHIEVADNVHITGMTMVTKSIKQAGSYSSGTAMMPSDKWRRSAVRFSQLDTLAARLKKLEREAKKH